MANHNYIAPAAQFIEVYFDGHQQHDEHCKGWRFHLYCRDDRNRMAAVNEAARKLIAEHHARNDRRAAIGRALLDAAE